MVFQDVAFLPSWASFYTTLQKDCGRDCHMSYNSGWGKQGNVPCNIFSLHQILLLFQFFLVI